ncbi:MAG: polysaccharide biosynthesis/export family protein [Nitrospiraceae bacterium]|nr:polysaccharide biosynthesis/export family protein [Nitrospiraceae bacterium]
MNDLIRAIVAAAVIALVATTLHAADYVIGEGDTLTISVWGEKELTSTVKVRPDGKITIPAVGEVAAANQTAEALQDQLKTKLRKIVRDPLVTVTVTEVTNNKAYVFGGGVKSGVYALTQRTTLLHLLCQIDDVKNADLKRAYVQRGDKKVREDFSRLYHWGAIEDDIILQPNDIIYIPVNLEHDTVFVMGAVNTPKVVDFKNGMTIMDAILAAGGFTKYADLNDTMIYRKESGRDVTLNVKVKRLMNDGDLTQNVLLRPGDYVMVNESLF